MWVDESENLTIQNEAAEKFSADTPAYLRYQVIEDTEE